MSIAGPLAGWSGSIADAGRVAATPGASASRPEPAAATGRSCQYESELSASPPLRVPSAHQIWYCTLFFTQRTEPSAKQMLIPPGWLQLGGIASMNSP